jgi:HAD superfamily hydrolase (TIGR01509 family)
MPNATEPPTLAGLEGGRTQSTPEPPRPGVLFDLDGTLVDTNYLHTLAWSRALADVGEWAPMNAIHRLVGMGGEDLVNELLGHDVPAAHEARARHYQELMPEARVFPGARSLLRRAHEAGLVVVLATSSPKDEVNAMLDLLDAGSALDAVTTADDVESAKPAPDVFLAALEAANVDPARAVVVGDSIWDVQAARSAGMGCVAVESGGFSQHELAEEGAFQVYRDVQEIVDQFFVGPLGRLAG